MTDVAGGMAARREAGGAVKDLQMEIVDEVDTPWLTVRISCRTCGALITESRLSALEDQGAAAGTIDAALTEEHLRVCPGRRVADAPTSSS